VSCVWSCVSIKATGSWTDVKPSLKNIWRWGDVTTMNGWIGFIHPGLPLTPVRMHIRSWPKTVTHANVASNKKWTWQPISQPIMSMDPFHEGQQTFEQEADHLEHQSGVILQGAVCLFLLWGWMEGRKPWSLTCVCQTPSGHAIEAANGRTDHRPRVPSQTI